MIRSIGKVITAAGKRLVFVLTQLGGGNGGHSQDSSARTLYEKPEDYRP